MSGSLRDQLIKAGLATADQARKAQKQVKAEKQAQGKQANRTNAQSTVQAKARAEAERKAAEKAEKDRELARIANEKVANKARNAEIRQLVAQHDMRTKEQHEDDVAYNFVHHQKVKRIWVTKEHQAQLAAGHLIIISTDGRFHLVKPEVAEQIRARDPRRVIEPVKDKKPEPGSDDGHYAKFAVPDDLDW
ncbi:MAG: DUF2058 domain-containing protein [Gammaproteobacteria bacterium]|nr:DUF2058 domain-containing protein [Gammaproteobacteria bacterium]